MINEMFSNTQETENQQCSVQPKIKDQYPRSNQAKIPDVDYIIAIGTDKLLSK